MTRSKLVPEGSPQELNALWGKLVSEILSEAWEEALQDLHKLKNAIDKSYLSALQQLQMKSWMLHWSLFIFFNHPSGMDELVDFFLACVRRAACHVTPDTCSPVSVYLHVCGCVCVCCRRCRPCRHIDTIQSNCPWLLRYLAATVLSNPRRANKMDEVVRVVVEEEYTYSDPITRFIKKLFVDYDFDGAQEELSECEAVLVTDIFLCRFSIDKAVIKHVVDEFMQHARMFVFESYCRIHRRIDLVVLAGKLGMPVSDAERWVVDLIGRASLNAKIDCSENHVLMTVQHASMYVVVVVVLVGGRGVPGWVAGWLCARADVSCVCAPQLPTRDQQDQGLVVPQLPLGVGLGACPPRKQPPQEQGGTKQQGRGQGGVCVRGAS